MKLIKTVSILILSFGIAANAFALRSAIFDFRSNEKQRQAVLEDSAHVLAELYGSEPHAKAVVEKAYGYATFSNFATKFVFVGSGGGRGVAVNNKTGQRTFMNMLVAQAGLGIGVKSYMLIWVFENEKGYHDFINSGWELGAQASAAAKAGSAGGALQGAMEIADGVYVYQLSGSGLALELTAQGTKYYKDNDLNNIK